MLQPTVTSSMNSDTYVMTVTANGPGVGGGSAGQPGGPRGGSQATGSHGKLSAAGQAVGGARHKPVSGAG
jgi:hypothetical protein